MIVPEFTRNVLSIMPKRFPKRYLALGFAACIALMVLADCFNTPAEADALDRLYQARPAMQLSAGISLAD